jgi:hypothetical protein
MYDDDDFGLIYSRKYQNMVADYKANVLPKTWHALGSTQIQLPGNALLATEDPVGDAAFCYNQVRYELYRAVKHYDEFVLNAFDRCFLDMDHYNVWRATHSVVIHEIVEWSRRPNASVFAKMLGLIQEMMQPSNFTDIHATISTDSMIPPESFIYWPHFMHGESLEINAAWDEFRAGGHRNGNERVIPLKKAMLDVFDHGLWKPANTDRENGVTAD